MDDDDSIDIDKVFCTSPETLTAGAAATDSSLPVKSRERYMTAYAKFTEWQKSMKTNSLSEDVLLAYLKKLAEQYQPSTLWSQYSMLKSVLAEKKVNIDSYTTLTVFLRKQSKGFQSVKTKFFEAKEIEKFLAEAPDDQWLATKVSAISAINVITLRHKSLLNV